MAKIHNCGHAHFLIAPPPPATRLVSLVVLPRAADFPVDASRWLLSSRHQSAVCQLSVNTACRQFCSLRQPSALVLWKSFLREKRK